MFTNQHIPSDSSCKKCKNDDWPLFCTTNCLWGVSPTNKGDFKFLLVVDLLKQQTFSHFGFLYTVYTGDMMWSLTSFRGAGRRILLHQDRKQPFLSLVEDGATEKLREAAESYFFNKRGSLLPEGWKHSTQLQLERVFPFLPSVTGQQWANFTIKNTLWQAQQRWDLPGVIKKFWDCSWSRVRPERAATVRRPNKTT